MITSAALHRHAAEQGLRFDQVEKDYVILWLLHGLARHRVLQEANWIFKGGTCLRHGYYQSYRFSEDIDFSCRTTGNAADQAVDVLRETLIGVQDGSGMRLTAKPPQASEGDLQIEIPVEYSRGGPRRQDLPCVKVHLTFDELILLDPIRLPIKPVYEDIPPFTIAAYSKLEIAAEKMRALIQQQRKWPRPRDLYDLWFLFVRSGETLPAPDVQRLFAEKCRARGLTPDPAALVANDLREWNRTAWPTILAPMIKDLPAYDAVWDAWLGIHARLFPSPPAADKKRT